MKGGLENAVWSNNYPFGHLKQSPGRNLTTSERLNVCRKLQPTKFTTSERSKVCRNVLPIEFTTSERSNVCLVVFTPSTDAQYLSAASVDGRL